MGGVILGTNFYWKNIPPELEKFITSENKELILHIGKRSGAGDYCCTCGTTMCKEGDRGIHHTSDNSAWYDKCPICGQRGNYICSFTWTFMKQKHIIEKYIDSNKYLIVNEYGEEFTPRKFLEEELSNSKVQYQMCWWFS